MTGLIAVLLVAVIGCQSLTDEGPNAQSGAVGAVVASADNQDSDASQTTRVPKFTTTDQDGTEFQVYSVRPVSDQIEINFKYTTAEGESANRIALLAQDGSKLMVQDGAYNLLTGMKVRREPNELSLRFYATEESILQFLRPPNSDDPIYVLMGSMEKSETVDFPGFESLDSAVSVYQNVQAGVVARGDLDEIDQALLSRAETIAGWTQYIDSSFSGLDISTASSLVRNPDFRRWAASGDDGSPTLDIPDVIRVVCKFIKIARKVCTILGDSQVCQWVEVLEMFCDILKEENIIK